MKISTSCEHSRRESEHEQLHVVVLVRDKKSFQFYYVYQQTKQTEAVELMHNKTSTSSRCRDTIRHHMNSSSLVYSNESFSSFSLYFGGNLFNYMIVERSTNDFALCAPTKQSENFLFMGSTLSLSRLHAWNNKLHCFMWWWCVRKIYFFASSRATTRS